MTITDDHSSDHHRMRSPSPLAAALTEPSRQSTVKTPYDAPSVAATATARRAQKRADHAARFGHDHRYRPVSVNESSRGTSETCFICCRGAGHMDIGHIISVHDGRAHGLSDAELFHDGNLVAMSGSATPAKGPRRYRCRFS